jgi:protein dithiol:quinone oxidoreductase
MNRLIQGRTPYLLVFAACVGLLAYALYAQFVLELPPCPLCMLQRYGFMLMGLVALAMAIHNPRSWGRWVYALPFFGGAAWGIATAGRHLRIQGTEPDLMGGCAADWQFMVETEWPMADRVREAFTATGECTEIDWVFLGVSMPGWTLVWYVLLSAFMLWALIARKPLK